MIDLVTYAQEVETGLNALVSNTSLAGGYQFLVVPDVMHLKRADRTGNNVVSYINAIMTAAPSANGTTNGGLQLAVDNITVRFLVPLEQMKSDPDDDPVSWQNEVNTFVALVKSIVNGYFQTNIVESYTVDGTTYATGFTYTLSATGTVDNQPMIGMYIDFAVYIEMSFVQNGMNSLQASLEMDGETVPFQILTPNRAPTQDVAVKSADSIKTSRTLTSSTALAFDIACPATTGVVTSQFNDFLLSGKSNIAHFVRFSMNATEGMSQYYLMTFNQISATVQGTQNIGLTMPLVEQAWYPEIIDFPEYMQVTELVLENPTDSVTFTIGANGIVAFSGESIADYTEGTETYTHTFSPAEVFYHEDEIDPAQTGYHAFIVACPSDKSSQTSIVQNVQKTMAISGSWEWNDTIVYTGSGLTQAVNATSGYLNGTSYPLSQIAITPHTNPSTQEVSAQIQYNFSTLGETVVYLGNWSSARNYQIIDFGATPQSVSEDFYNFLTANAHPKEGLSGVWKFNASVISLYPIGETTEPVANGTTIGGVAITSFVISTGTSATVNVYVTPQSGGENIQVCTASVLVSVWDSQYAEVDFGTQQQFVSDDFYTFVTSNATKQS